MTWPVETAPRWARLPTRTAPSTSLKLPTQRSAVRAWESSPFSAGRMSTRPPVRCGVLGLRFFGCQRCDTVYAGPEPPPRCTNCAGDEFAELTGRLQGDTYFSSPDSR